MILATRRFLLRDFTPADAAAFAALRGGPPAEAEALLDRFIAWSRDDPRRNWQLAATTRDGTLLGTAGLRGAGLPPDEAEFGIEIAPAWRGRHGVALELARAMIGHGFARLGLGRIVIETTEGNRPAIRLATHLGFAFARDAAPPAAEARPLRGLLDRAGWRDA